MSSMPMDVSGHYIGSDGYASVLRMTSDSVDRFYN